MLYLIIFAIFLLPYTISNRVYVGTGNGVLYLSDDDGRNWKDIGAAVYYSNAIIATDANIYMGSAGNYRSYPGLYISANDGQTWKELTNNSINSFFVSSENKLYVGTTSKGLGISVDGGESWVQKTTADGLGSNNVISVYVAEDVIYAATENAGLSISADGGKTWTIKQTAQGLASARVNSVFAIGDSVLVATRSGISISKDRGQTWVTKNKQMGFQCYSSENIYSAMMSGNTIYASFDPETCSLCLCLGISTDGGNTWTYKKLDDGVGASGSSFFVLGGEIYMGDSSKLSISRDNGNTWITQSMDTRSLFVLPDTVK